MIAQLFYTRELKYLIYNLHAKEELDVIALAEVNCDILEKVFASSIITFFLFLRFLSLKLIG